MATIGDLKTGLEQAVRDGRLTLTRELVGVESVGAFLDTLPSRGLSLSVTSPEQIRLADPQTLVVEGASSEQWPVRGLGDSPLRLSGATLTLTQASGAAPVLGRLDVRGDLDVAGAPVALGGGLSGGEGLRLGLGSVSTHAFSLTELVRYATSSAVSTQIADLVPLFQSLSLTALELSFGFAPGAATSLTATLGAADGAGGWDFVEGFSIKGIGVRLEVKHLFPDTETSLLDFGGAVFGKLVIGQEFDVELGIQGGKLWELSVHPLGGDVVPGLYELAGLAGGESLRNEVRQGFELLGLDAFSVTGVNIGFRLSPPGVTYVDLRGRMLIDDIPFDIEAELPDFGFGGRLAAGHRISLKSIAAKYFSGAEEMPEIDVTSLSVVADPSLGEYGLQVAVEDDWEFGAGVGSFKLGKVELEVKRSSAGFKGSLSAGMTVGGLPVFVTAASPDGDAGWRFEGHTGVGDSPGIGELISDLGSKFGVQFPDFVNDIKLEQLAVKFDTRTKDFEFSCDGLFPLGDDQVEISLTILINNKSAAAQPGGQQQQAGAGVTPAPAAPVYEKKLSGTIRVVLGERPNEPLNFKLALDKDDLASSFAASYAGTEKVNIKALVGALSAEVADLVPEGVELTLKDAFFIVSRQAAAGQTPAVNRFLFGLDIGANVSLSQLPLVGGKFPPDKTAGVEDLQFVVASHPFTQAEVSGFGALLAEGVKPLPAKDLGKGVTVSAVMQWGGTPQSLSLPVLGGGPAPGTAAPRPAGSTTTPAAGGAAAPPTASTDNAKWFTLQKAFGPVYFEKVGVKFQDAAVWFLLNASLSAAGLTLSLDGLAVGSPVSDFDPKFDLRGLGVQYKGGGEVEVGGALLRARRERTDKPGEFYDEYDGAAFVKAGQLKLSALGSYAELDGHPSLFVYAVLDYPIGGPSFFFVTGLAAGFGYNRSLVVPPIEQVAQFPLVADAVSGAAMPADVGQKVAGLQRYVPPSVGDYFLAVGIKFTSFKLIDSFVLLTVSFGTQFEVNLLGLSTLIVPTPIPGQAVTPLAEVQLAVRATFNPGRGFLGVAAQLTSNSFILSRDCRLTGGFAFYSWFGKEHKGDFVLTLGGYHPDYKVPAHYPSVPRLGFNWRVDNKLSIKGGAYYALTAAALMAGGSLQATWDSGDLKAHFTAGADFIVYWRPYHYDAKVYVDIGVSYTYNLFGTHHLNVDVGADLHIWGPEFAGTAHVKLSIISFDISFGAGSSRKLQPVDWNTFKESFLPKGKDGGLEICGVSVAEGLLGTPAGAEVKLGGGKGGDEDGTVKVDWFVDPKSFVLVTNSVIPSKEAYKRDAPVALGGKAGTAVGIAPMALASADLYSRHTVSLSHMNEKGVFVPADGEFELKPVTKNVPVALWGQSLTPSLNGPAFVADTLAGFEVSAAAVRAPDFTADIPRSALQYENEDVARAYAWQTFRPFTPKTFGGADEEAEEAKRRAAIFDGIGAEATAAARARLLGALGVTDAVDLSGYGADDFNIPPQVEAA